MLPTGSYDGLLHALSKYAPMDERTLLQVYDDEVEEYIDLERDCTMVAKSKIKESWKLALKNKFKNSRKKAQNASEEMEIMRALSSRKRLRVPVAEAINKKAVPAVYGIYPTSAKIKAIQDAPEPMNLTELRAYLGLLNFYGKFLADLATVAAPLYELLKKEQKWCWTKECKQAFETTKTMICDSEILTFYDFRKPLGLSFGDRVFVKTVRGEVESWQEGIVEQVVSPATYLVKIGDYVRFTHVDHLRKRWTSAAIYHHPQPNGTEVCEDITVREPSHSEPSSEGNNVISGSGLNEGTSRGVFRDEHHVQGHDDVDEDEDVPDPKNNKGDSVYSG
ncbi:hypothetical protein MTO96_015799 [Rhipicephalus appendiculatus]